MLRSLSRHQIDQLLPTEVLWLRIFQVKIKTNVINYSVIYSMFIETEAVDLRTASSYDKF